MLMPFMSLFLGTMIMPTSFTLALFATFLLDWLDRVAFGVNIVL